MHNIDTGMHRLRVGTPTALIVLSVSCYYSDTNNFEREDDGNRHRIQGVHCCYRIKDKETDLERHSVHYTHGPNKITD